MSTSIDSRVVEMRFDNQDFEKNASATLNVLKNLDKSLNGFGAVESLGNITAAANKADLSGLEKGIETVKQKFSALEVIAVGALLNIGNKAVDAGSRLLKSFTTDNIIAGWDRYADKTSAVQTIMGATANQFSDTAVQMKYVEEELERLSWFTDETSFRFVDMVDNIGKFTSAGVALDDAVVSMQGIALWGAKSGATAEQTSRAMYNLSQAMSMGKLTIQDWRSIENANMATMEFKNTAIELGKELGILKDAGDGFVETMKGTKFSAAKGFRDSLSEGWLNDQVLTKTFSKYGEFTNKLHAATSDTGIMVADMLGYIDEYKEGVLDLGAAAEEEGISIDTLKDHLDILSDSALDFGRVAFRMGQEAKTFQEAVEYVGEAVSSQWMRTFEIIFGNYEEAKKLWTAVSDELYEIFVKGAEDRNTLLEEWVQLGGRTDLFRGIANIWNTIKDVVGAVKKAWDEVFPPATANTLYNITKAFADLTSNLRPSQETLNNISTLFKGLFSVLKTGVNIVKAVAYAFKPLLDVIGRAILSFGKASASVGGFFGEGLIKAEEVIRKVVFALAKLVNLALTILTKIPVLEIAVGALATAFGALQKGIEFVIGKFSEFAQSNKFLSALIDGVKDIGKVFTEVLPNAFKNGGIKGIFDSLMESIKNFISKIREIKIFDTIFSGVEKAADVALNVIKTFITAVIGIFAGFVTKVKNSGLKDVLKWIGDTVLEIGGKIIDFFKNINLQEIIGSIKEHILLAGDGLAGFVEKIRNFAKAIDPAKLIALGFSLAILAVANNLTKAADAFTAIGGLANEIKKKIVSPFQSIIPKISPMLQFAIVVLTVSKSLKELSTVPTDKLQSVIASVSTLSVVLGGVVGVLSVVTSKFGGGSKNLDSLSKALLGLGAGIGAMGVGLAALNASGDPSGLLPKVMGLIAIIGAFGTVATLMSKFGGTKVVNSLMLITLAGSLTLLMKEISKLANINVSNLPEKIGALSLVMGALGVLAAGLGNIRIGSVVGVLLLKNVLTSFIPAIVDAVSSMKIDPGLVNTIKENEDLFKALTILVGTTMIGLVSALAYFAKSLSKLTFGLMGLSLAIVLLTEVAKSLKKAEFDVGDVLKAILFIGGLMGLFAIIIKIANGGDAGKHALKLSTMIVSVTAMVGVLSGLAIVIGQIKDFSVVKRGVGAIGVLMLLFSAVIVASSLAKDVKSSVIIGAVVGIVALTGEMIALTFVPAEDLKRALISIGFLMTALAGTLAIIGKIKYDPNSGFVLLGAAGMIASIGLSLYALKDISWQQLIASMASLGTVIISMGICATLIKDSKMDIPTALILAGFVAEITFALNYLKDIPWQQALGAAGGLSAVLLALGGTVRLISGVKVGMDAIAAMAVGAGSIIAIAYAFQILAPSLESLANVTWESLGKAGSILLGLATGVLVLSDAGKEALLGALGLDAAAASLRILAPALETIQNVSWATIGKAGAILAGLTGSIAALGALKQYALLGAGAIDLVALGMLGLAKAIEIFAPAMEKVDPYIGDIPKLGGALSILGGSGVLGLVGGPGIAALGGGLSLLAPSLKEINGLDISKSAKELSEMAGACIVFAGGGLAIGAASGPMYLAAGGIGALGKAVDISHTAFSKAMPGMTETFEKGVEKLKTVAAGVGDAIIAPLKLIATPIIAIMTIIGKGIETGFRDGTGYHSPIPWIEDFKSAFVSSLTNLPGGDIVQTFVNIGDGIKNGFLGAAGEGQGILDNLFSSMTGMVGVSDTLTASFGNISASGLDLTTMMQQLGVDFDSATFGAELFNGELNNTSAALDGVNYNAMLADIGTEGLGNDMGQTAEKAAELSAKSDELSNSLLTANGNIDKSSESYANLKEAITNSMNIFDEFQEKQAISSQEILTNMENHLNAIADWADNIALLGTKGIDEGLLQKLVDMGPEGAAQVAAFAGMTDDEIKKANKLWVESLKLPEEATKTVAEGMKTVANAAKDGFVDTNEKNSKDMIDSINKPMEEGVKQVNRTWQTHSPSRVTKELGENILKGLKNGLGGPVQSQVMTTITQFGNKMVNEFNSIAREVINKFSDSFRNNVSDMTYAIERGFDDCIRSAQDSVRDLIDRIRSEADSSVNSSNFESIGEDIGYGIANGIESSASIQAICEAAREAVRKAKQAAQEEADIESPSKVFAKEVGKPITEGIAVGMLKSNATANASKSLIDTILNSMQQIDNILQGNIDFDPVITPRLDLSYLNSGINAINHSFESKRLIAATNESTSTDNQENVAGGIVYNQYNYSPKSLSRLDMYRNTKNLLSGVRGFTNVQGAQYG